MSITLTKDTSGWQDDESLAASYRAYSALIPARSAFDRYIETEALGYSDLSLLHVARQMGTLSEQQNVLLYGPTGPGKTSSVLAYGAREREAVAVLSCSGGGDTRKWWGKWIPRTDGQPGLVWRDGLLTAMFRFGGIALYDEINMLRPDVSAGVFTALRQGFIVLEDRDDEIVFAPHEFVGHTHQGECPVDCSLEGACDICHDVPAGLPHERFDAGHYLLQVGAMNPGYEGTRALNPALHNRFTLHLHRPYERDVEEELVDCTALLDLAQELRKGVAEGTLETETPTNALMEFDRWAKHLGVSFAIGNFVNRFQPHETPVVNTYLNDLVRSRLLDFYGDDTDADEAGAEADVEEDA